MEPKPNTPKTQPGPAIDYAHLRSQTLGDSDLERELLELFAQQARNILADLTRPSATPAAGRLDDAGLLHTLSGSARAVGAWDVAAGADRLEHAARAAALAAEPLRDLESSVTAACAEIDRRHGAEDACGPPPQP